MSTSLSVRQAACDALVLAECIAVQIAQSRLRDFQRGFSKMSISSLLDIAKKQAAAKPASAMPPIQVSALTCSLSLYICWSAILRSVCNGSGYLTVSMTVCLTVL